MRLSSPMPMVITSSAMPAGGGRFGHMWGWGWGMVLFGWLFMVLIVGLVVWLIVLATRRSEPGGGSVRGALDLLDERYARGETDRKEYLQRRADLER